jgi:pyruvate formate lyase activating enzyme
MTIAGIKGISLIDYPQKVATVLYLSQCNFRCPFCHNKELVLGKGTSPLAEEPVLEILASRRDFVDGIVITGGEPTIYPGLLELLGSIKKLGFAVKLDTNGYNSGVLQLLFAARVVDFVAMDIKTSWKKYNQATGIKVNVDRLRESLNLIKHSNIEHEFRTTCVPSLVDDEDIKEISRLVDSSGLFTLQQYQPENTLNSDYTSIIPYSHHKLLDFLEIARRNTTPCRLTGLQ